MSKYSTASIAIPKIGNNTDYNKRRRTGRTTVVAEKTGHTFFVKEENNGIVVASQEDDNVTFNNITLPLEAFNAYYEHKEKECRKCNGGK